MHKFRNRPPRFPINLEESRKVSLFLLWITNLLYSVLFSGHQRIVVWVVERLVLLLDCLDVLKFQKVRLYGLNPVRQQVSFRQLRVDKHSSVIAKVQRTGLVVITCSRKFDGQNTGLVLVEFPIEFDYRLLHLSDDCLGPNSASDLI